MSKIVEGYKGFDDKLACTPWGRSTPFKYKIGKRYEENRASICYAGFHFCSNPLRTFSFYAPGKASRYCRVTGEGTIVKGDYKYASTIITIGQELSYAELAEEVAIAVEKNLQANRVIQIASSRVAVEHKLGYSHVIAGLDLSLAVSCRQRSKTTTKGRYSIASTLGEDSFAEARIVGSIAASTGPASLAKSRQNGSIAASTGFYSLAKSEGFASVAAITGEASAVTALGKWSVAACTGMSDVTITEGAQSIAAATRGTGFVTNNGQSGIAVSTHSDSKYAGVVNNGVSGIAVSSGDTAVVTNTGDYGTALGTGIRSKVSASGKNSIAIASGSSAQAKGDLGSWLVLAERTGKTGEITGMKCVQVDGEKIKPGVWYKLRKGEVVETRIRKTTGEEA